MKSAELTPTKRHWMPTREAWIKDHLQDKPNNLVIRFSAPMVDQRAPASWPNSSEVVTQGPAVQLLHKTTSAETADNAGTPQLRQFHMVSIKELLVLTRQSCNTRERALGSLPANRAFNSDQVISEATATAHRQRAPGPGLKPSSSFKPSSSKHKLQATKLQAASDKLQAPSSKHQAPSRKRQAP